MHCGKHYVRVMHTENFFANQYDICIFLAYCGFWLKASGRTAAFSSLGFHNISANHDLLLDAHPSSALSQSNRKSHSSTTETQPY